MELLKSVNLKSLFEKFSPTKSSSEKTHPEKFFESEKSWQSDSTIFWICSSQSAGVNIGEIRKNFTSPILTM